MPEQRKMGAWATFKSRHPHTARVARNLAVTGAVVGGLALSSKAKFRAFEKAGRGGLVSRESLAARQFLLKQANRRRKAAYIVGIPATLGSVGSPFERWYSTKQRQRQARQNPYIVTVVSARTGQTRQLHM